MTADVRQQLTGHHNVMRRVAGHEVVARPLRYPSWWRQKLTEWRCRKTLGHCWHADGFVDWWCCFCSGETEGMPPNGCKVCAPSGTQEADG